MAAPSTAEHWGFFGIRFDESPRAKKTEGGSNIFPKIPTGPSKTRELYEKSWQISRFYRLGSGAEARKSYATTSHPLETNEQANKQTNKQKYFSNKQKKKQTKQNRTSKQTKTQ